MLRGIEVIGVFVPAQNIDGVAADAQPWPRNQPLVDGVANRSVGRARAFGAHVALGGEAGHQVGLGRLLGQNRAPRNGFLDRLQILRAGMQKQMHVRVDQAGQQRGIAEIDDLRALRMIDRRSHRLDALALDQNLAGLEHVSGIDLKQPRRVQHDGRRGRLLRSGGNGQSKSDGAGHSTGAGVERKSQAKVSHGNHYRPSGPACRLEI